MSMGEEDGLAFNLKSEVASPYVAKALAATSHAWRTSVARVIARYQKKKKYYSLLSTRTRYMSVTEKYIRQDK